MSTRVASNNLRQQQTEDTRSRILEAALGLLATETNPALTHDDIAAHSGIARRTVYRHFPSRAELFDAIWSETDRRLELGEYPSTEADLIAAVEVIYGKMDQNTSLMRGLLHSNAGLEMRERDRKRRHAAIERAMAPSTEHLTPAGRKQATAIVQLLFSGRTWEMLRDRGGLNDGEVAPAVNWAIATLLEQLHKDQARLKRAGTAATNGKAAPRRDVAGTRKPPSKKRAIP